MFYYQVREASGMSFNPKHISPHTPTHITIHTNTHPHTHNTHPHTQHTSPTHNTHPPHTTHIPHTQHTSPHTNTHQYTSTHINTHQHTSSHAPTHTNTHTPQFPQQPIMVSLTPCPPSLHLVSYGTCHTHWLAQRHPQAGWGESDPVRGWGVTRCEGGRVPTTTSPEARACQWCR